MSRSVKEWVGKTDDTKPPPRVLLRIFEREQGVCHISGRKIMPGEKWQADHKIALINGGENRESNLFPALVGPHATKTKEDVAEKAHVAALAKSHLGASAPSSRPIARKPPKPPLRVAAGDGDTNLMRRFKPA